MPEEPYRLERIPNGSGMWLEYAALCLFRKPRLICSLFQQACFKSGGRHARSQIAQPSGFLGITAR
jgi:hypothetical protein